VRLQEVGRRSSDVAEAPALLCFPPLQITPEMDEITRRLRLDLREIEGRA
jgi:hypothetical protein